MAEGFCAPRHTSSFALASLPAGFWGLLVSYVIDSHEETLRSLVVLASFIPIITGMGGNAATHLWRWLRIQPTGSIDPRHLSRSC